MRTIPVHDINGVTDYATVDDADYAELATHRWHRDRDGYVRRWVGGKRRPRIVLMHRQILGLAEGDPRTGDHINRDTRDNRRTNLRILAATEQQQNVGSRAGATSRFRGVCWDSERNLWLAYVKADGRYRNLGRFADEIEAARTAEAKRLALMPYAEPDTELARIGP